VCTVERLDRHPEGREALLVVGLEVYERPSAAGYHRVTLLDDTLDVDLPGLASRWRVADLLP
jgi:hypothetical protein